MTPSSGASTTACCRRSCRVCSMASAAATRAWAVCCAVAYCSTSWRLSAPLSLRLRARRALPSASAALARASCRLARLCARSACTLRGSNRASTWPRRTPSPTLTSTASSRRPLLSVPTLASCQAAMSPWAERDRGSTVRAGKALLMVSAGRCAAAGGSLSALGCKAHHSTAAPASSASTVQNRAEGLQPVRAFMDQGQTKKGGSCCACGAGAVGGWAVAPTGVGWCAGVLHRWPLAAWLSKGEAAQPAARSVRHRTRLPGHRATKSPGQPGKPQAKNCAGFITAPPPMPANAIPASGQSKWPAQHATCMPVSAASVSVSGSCVRPQSPDRRWAACQVPPAPLRRAAWSLRARCPAGGWPGQTRFPGFPPAAPWRRWPSRH